jgi:hypothetical protein
MGCLCPLVRIVRDGLGPDSHDSGWIAGAFMFAGMWGIPALALAGPLYGRTFIKSRQVVTKQIEPTICR